MTDYTEEQKAKMREWDEHNQKMLEQERAERAAYLSVGNRHARRKLKALSRIEGREP